MLKEKSHQPRILYPLNDPSEWRRQFGRQNEAEEALLAAWLWAEVLCVCRVGDYFLSAIETQYIDQEWQQEKEVDEGCFGYDKFKAHQGIYVEQEKEFGVEL